MTAPILKSPIILNRRPTLPERGHIKVGMKGQMRQSAQGKSFQPPMKLDHFLITTMERGPDGNFKRDDEIHQKLAQYNGGNPDKITRIPVKLLYNDTWLNFQSRYASFSGREVFCTGNGQWATRKGMEQPMQCPCDKLLPQYNAPDKCKPNGKLSVIIQGAGGTGGVYVFRTTSYNSVDGLTGTLAFFSQVTGGQLAGLSLWLTVNPKEVSDPNGKTQTIYTVKLEYDGSEEELREAAYKIAQSNVAARLRLEHIEQEQRQHLELEASRPPAPGSGVFQGESADEVVEEFYPQAAVAGQPAPIRDDAKPQEAAVPVASASTESAEPPWPPERPENGNLSQASWEDMIFAMGQAETIPALEIVRSKAKAEYTGKWSQAERVALSSYYEAMKKHITAKV